MRSVRCVAFVVSVAGLGACGGASQKVVVPPPGHVDASNQIIGTRAEGTAKELLAKGERALLAQRWQEAVDAFEAVLAGDAAAANDPQVVYDLALAYEGLGDREKARARYREVVRRFPADPNARNALVREVSLDAHLEDWPALGEVGRDDPRTEGARPRRAACSVSARAVCRRFKRATRPRRRAPSSRGSS